MSGKNLTDLNSDAPGCKGYFFRLTEYVLSEYSLTQMEKVTRQEQKEKTRSGLIRKAEDLFASHGISRTSTADIAKALHISHGALFVHFPTREDLIQAVVDDFGERLSAALGSRCATNLKLKDLLKAHLSVLSEFEDFYLRLISESRNLPPSIRGVVYSMNASLSYRFYHAAKPGMEAGEIKKISQVLLFNTWMGLVQYYILNRDLLSEKTPILEQVDDELIRHFLNLIKT